MILRASRIATLEGPDAPAVAIRDGRIAAVGDVRPERGERVVEVDGVVLPGFHDAHLHFLMATRDEHAIDAGPVASPTTGALLAHVERRAAERRPGEWITAAGYDDSSVRDAARLDRAALDRAAPGHPVLVTHVSGHWAVANTEALRRGGFLTGPPPAGGELGRDAAGQPNGYVYETALFAFQVPELDDETWCRCARAVNERFHAAGLTSVCDAWVHPEQVRRLQLAEARGDLTLRLAMLVDHAGFDPAQHLAPLGERLTFAGVKWFVDGAIGGRTAYLDEPYVGTEDHGIEVLPPSESEAIARRVHAAGGRVAVHANGDRAIRGLLDAFERVAAELGPLRRPRVEHCTLVDDTIVARLRALGAVVLPFAAYTRMYGGKLVDWYGDRVDRMFAHRTFLDHGVSVAASTDHPVAPVEPLNAMQALVTRTGRDDGVVVGPSQRVTIDEALRLYTRGAAYAEESERDCGRLAPGFRADLVVLDRDPREVPPDELASLAVGATIVGGDVVWSAPGVELAPA